MGVLDETFNIGIMNIGQKAIKQTEAIEEFVFFMADNYPIEFSIVDHPFITPHEWGGLKWLQDRDYMMANLDIDLVPFDKQILVFLWECCCAGDDVWGGGGAFGADYGVAGAATASVPTNGCNVWWFDPPQHGFDHWGTQIMVHEVRNCISWYYNTYYVPIGYPVLPDTYAGWCDQFVDLKTCYEAWYAELNASLGSRHEVEFVIPDGSELLVDGSVVPM